MSHYIQPPFTSLIGLHISIQGISGVFSQNKETDFRILRGKIFWGFRNVYIWKIWSFLQKAGEGKHVQLQFPPQTKPLQLSYTLCRLVEIYCSRSLASCWSVSFTITHRLLHFITTCFAFLLTASWQSHKSYCQPSFLLRPQFSRAPKEPELKSLFLTIVSGWEKMSDDISAVPTGAQLLCPIWAPSLSRPAYVV